MLHLLALSKGIDDFTLESGVFWKIEGSTPRVANRNTISIAGSTVGSPPSVGCSIRPLEFTNNSATSCQTIGETWRNQEKQDVGLVFFTAVSRVRVG